MPQAVLRYGLDNGATAGTMRSVSLRQSVAAEAPERKRPEMNKMEQTRHTRTKWAVFTAATLGYGLFYVCRLSLNVVKKPIVDAGYLTETELGIIGSALFFSYAIGKFVNGFLADRVNVRYLMAGGLLVAALVNFILGFAVPFWAFVILWAVNGWAQSVGGPCSVIALNRWFDSRQRGTVYGFWSASHNIGEAVTFIVTSFVVGWLGWQWGFMSAACLGAVGVALIFAFLKPSPEGYAPAAESVADGKGSSVNGRQLEVLKTPMIWALALASGFMYISRYAVNSWGVYYFAADKGYDLVSAGSLISVSSVFGIVGTVFSGLISDKFFNSDRNLPACLFSLLNLVSLALFLFGPSGCHTLDVVAMVLFGISVGVLICFLGGLMAVDIAPEGATGAALGIIGVSSYMAAGLQDIVSGFLIESRKTVIDGVTVYDFSAMRLFWLGAACMSLLLLLLILVAARRKRKTQSL